ncbi:MAG: hypothetical protein ACK53Y_12065 [bacterium]
MFLCPADSQNESYYVRPAPKMSCIYVRHTTPKRLQQAGCYCTSRASSTTTSITVVVVSCIGITWMHYMVSTYLRPTH